MKKPLVFSFTLVVAGLVLLLLLLRAGKELPDDPVTDPIQGVVEPRATGADGEEAHETSVGSEEGPSAEHDRLQLVSPLAEPFPDRVATQSLERVSAPGRRLLLGGLVTDEAHVPLGRVSVRLMLFADKSSSEHVWGKISSSRGDGRFYFYDNGTSLPEGERTEFHGVLEVWNPDYLPYREELIVPVGGLDDVKILLKSADSSIVSGIVYGAERRPMPGVIVKLSAIDSEFARRSRITAEDGAFALRGVPPGRYGVEVSQKVSENSSRGVPVISPEQVHVHEGGEQGVVILTDREASPGAVAGRVLDEEGRPVAGASFDFSYPGYSEGKMNTQADPEGAFAFMGIPASVSEVSFRVYYDQQPHDFLVAVGEMDAELVVSPSPRVSCTVVVVDGVTAQPIPAAEVRLPSDSRTWVPTQGGKAVVDLAEGRWLIRARAPGYNEANTVQTVSLEEENVFEIELGVAVELHVLVVMHEWLGQLLPGENLEEWRTRAMGVFAVAPDMTQVIEPSRMEGDVLVFPVGREMPFAVGVQMTMREHPEAASTTVKLKTEPALIPKDATGPLTVGLRLGGDCAVRGNISGLVPSGVRISTRGGIPGVLQDGIAMLGYEEERSVNVDEDGEFAFSALAPGAYRIAFRRQNLEGDWEKLHEDVLLSAPGEVIDLEWP